MESSGSRRVLPDALRGIGGIAFAAGAIVLVLRKSSGHEWSTLARFFTVLIPAALLYLLALAGGSRASESAAGGSPGGRLDEGRGEAAEGVANRDRTGEPARRGSTALLLTASLLLLLAALFLFLQLVKASTSNNLYVAAVFAVVGLAAAFGASRARVAYAALLAGLAFLLAWFEVLDEIIGKASAGEVRWLSIGGAALLFAVSLIAVQRRSIASREIATAGGIAAVFAGVIGIFAGLGLTFLRALPFGHPSVMTSTSGRISAANSRALTSHGRAFASMSSHRIPHLGLGSRGQLATLMGGAQTLGWDIYLLVVSLALLAIGARSRSRGLAYVGGAGLLAFLFSVASELTRLEAGKTQTHAFVGWPLALLLIGAVALVISFVAARARSNES